jgi:hypothetical protein
MNTRYNGWTNYATWRINLEMIEGYETDTTDKDELGIELKEFVESYLEESSKGLPLDYAKAFISDVNWYEIAEHLIEESNNEKV